MGVNTSTNSALERYAEAPFNFPQEYNPENPPRKLVSIFDRISPRQPSNRHDQCPPPRNRQHEGPAKGNANAPPRNKRERSAEQARQRADL